MADEQKLFRVWESGLKNSTYQMIMATTMMKAKEAYAAEWTLSISTLEAEEMATTE